MDLRSQGPPSKEREMMALLLSTIMISNAVEHFLSWRERRTRSIAHLQAVNIDVIVRVGGRPVDLVVRAIDSIERQSCGRIRVILVRYAPIDLSALLAREWRRIVA